VTGLVVESLRLAIQKPAWAHWSLVAYPLALIWNFTRPSEATLYTLYYIFYALHPLLVCLFFITLPSTPLLHVLTTPLNVFFSKLDRPLGKLAPIPQDAHGVPLYARTLCNLTWSQLLNGDGCTECGRCQDACPAYAAGQPLNPKQVMLGLRESLRRNGPGLNRNAEKAPALIGNTGLTEEVLWSCTSCGACVQECPVLLEHVDAIVDMRRYLVSEGRLDSKAQDVLNSLGRYGNSFGLSERARAKWAQALDPKVKDARKNPVEYLWFVGDYASYNPALTEITQRTAKVFQRTGIDFGILYEAERNAGNDVRRVGEEGLFEMLVEKNGAALSKCGFKAIVTTDPHSFNTLKHEYPTEVISGRPVLHYAEFLDRLVASGQLKFSKKLGYKVTYHDPCYLGRYNMVYDAPRRVIQATGCEIIEMPRAGRRALCCGAGGGRIWMEEKDIKERPSESRIREAVGLDGIQYLVVACPKDTTMYRDAVKTTGNEQKLVVKDLIDLVNEAL
jgi:Fe-S oxidoreductase